MTYPYKLNRAIIIAAFVNLTNITFGQVYVRLISDSQQVRLHNEIQSSQRLKLLFFRIDSSSVVSINYLDSNLISEGMYVDNEAEGIWLQYFEAGSIKRAQNYLGGCIDGISTEYYSNGNIKSIENYSCLNPDTIIVQNEIVLNEETGDEIEKVVSIDSHSVKNGYCYYFNEIGVCTKIELWLMGVLIKDW